MSDPGKELQARFRDANRYSNFGNVLTRMSIQGFRCHSNTIVGINSPITAFCGLNGTGKSTLLQLAAAAYKLPLEHRQPDRPYYIRDFLVVGTLDPNPFTDDARVEYRFWQQDRSHRPLTLSRNASTKRWQGYQRRMSKGVFFAGVGLYLPRIEWRDFVIQKASLLTISSSNEVSTRIKEWTCKVIGLSYDHILSNIVQYNHREDQVISVQRGDTKYSEAHMGYGEGRTQFLIEGLETFPDKSLVLIEEPETSLHPSAQFELGRYLVDVALHKGHQILLTTHSEFILEALPAASRVYLSRTDNGIITIPGLTSLQARSLMAQGHVKALTILVEDNCAKAVLTEILRLFDQSLLSTMAICDIGGADVIRKVTSAIQKTGLKVAAVLDGDQQSTPRENIFKLPGSEPPEKEIFKCQNVKSHVLSKYGISLTDFSASLVGVDHHDWLKRMAEQANIDEAALVYDVAYVYARSLPESEVASLANLLKAASG